MSGLGEPGDRHMQPTEELPQMDGSCDACEPDEAQPATQMCRTCSFAFCTAHGERHGSSTRHPLTPYSREEPPPPPRRLERAEIMAGRVAFEAQAAGRMAKIEDFIGDHIAVLGEMIHQAGDAIVERVGLIGERPGIEAQNGLLPGDDEGATAEGAEAGEEAVAAPERGKKDTVTVERLRCTEHGQEGSLYCKPDEKIICVVCAVQGDHREHEIITLHEAYLWQKNREGYDLLGCTRRMSEKMKTKWTNPEMSTEELEAYVNQQFDELRRLARLEEKRTLHLVDLKEAFLTAHAAEKIAEINVHTERLEEEMASITHQLDLLDQAENNEAMLLGGAARAVLEGRPAPRPPRDIEARPRLPQPRRDPVDRRDYDDNEPGPSMGHAP